MASRPELNLVAERYRFRQRQQHPHESVDDYIFALRSLVVSCDYGSMWQEMIRDQLVEKTRSPLIRKLLLSVPDVTLEVAVSLARLSEDQTEQGDNLRLDSGRQDALGNHNVPIPSSPDHSGRVVDMLQKPASDKQRPTTQTQLNAKRRRYHEVQRLLNDQIHPTSPLFSQLRLAAHIYLEPATVVGCQQPSDILDALCVKHFASEEDYKCLCEILKEAKLNSLMHGVEKLQNKNFPANTAYYEDTKRDCTSSDVKPDLATGATADDEHPRQRQQRLSGSGGRSQIPTPVSAKFTRRSTVEDKTIMKSTSEPVISSPPAQRELNYANNEDTRGDCTSSDVKPYLPSGATVDDERTRQRARTLSGSRGRSLIPTPVRAKLMRGSTVEDKLVSKATATPVTSSLPAQRDLNYETSVTELLVKLCGKLDYIAEVLTRGEEQYESIGIQESRQIVTLDSQPPDQQEATVTETVEYQTPAQPDPDPEYHCTANCPSPFLDINDN